MTCAVYELSGAAEDLTTALQLRVAHPDAKDMPKEVDIMNQLAWISERRIRRSGA